MSSDDGDASLNDVLPRLTEIEARFKRLELLLNSQSRQLERIGNQLAATLRASVDPVLWPPDLPYALNFRRFGITSQNGEDGVLAAVVAMLGTPLRRFVEIGCGDNGGNSGLFAGELGWSGLMIDMLDLAIEQCRERYGHNPEVRLVLATVTPENVNELIRHSGLDGEIDYLSLDIDSVDYWVLEALDACRPRVLVLEYNAYLGREVSLTVPRDADLASAPQGYFGASLVALTRLARRKGYRLLACEETGVNAFFLREDLRTDIPAVEPGIAFRTIKITKGRRAGEPRDAARVIRRITRAELPLVEV